MMKQRPHPQKGLALTQMQGGNEGLEPLSGQLSWRPKDRRVVSWTCWPSPPPRAPSLDVGSIHCFPETTNRNTDLSSPTYPNTSWHRLVHPEKLGKKRTPKIQRCVQKEKKILIFLTHFLYTTVQHCIHSKALLVTFSFSCNEINIFSIFTTSSYLFNHWKLIGI